MWGPHAKGALRPGHELNPISYSSCGAIPLAGGSPQPLSHTRPGQVDPFIPIYWNLVVINEHH